MKKIKVGDIVRILEDEDIFLTKGKLARVISVCETDLVVEELQNPYEEGPWWTAKENVELVEENEEKTALGVGTGMSEYTNPAPIENTIYVPVHGTQGTISATTSATTLGGDSDSKSFVDLIEYLRDKLSDNLKVPRQFLSEADDDDTARAYEILEDAFKYDEEKRDFYFIKELIRELSKHFKKEFKYDEEKRDFYFIKELTFLPDTYARYYVREFRIEEFSTELLFRLSKFYMSLKKGE